MALLSLSIGVLRGEVAFGSVRLVEDDRPYYGDRNDFLVPRVKSYFYNDHSIHGNRLPRNLIAQQDSNVTLVGQWGYGSCNTVFVEGNYAYIGSGRAMQILDISNPSSPEKVGVYVVPDDSGGSYSKILCIHVVGDRAYVASGDLGLWIIDVSNPEDPYEAGCFDTYGTACEVYVLENHAYVAEGYEAPPPAPPPLPGLRIIDVSDPENPFQVGYFDTSPDGWTTGVGLQGDHAFISVSAGCHSGMKVVDVSDPQNPSATGHFYTAATLSSLWFRDPYVYAIGPADLLVIDVSDPTDPNEVGSLCEEGGGWPGGVHVCDSRAYVGLYGDMLIIDVSNSANPNLVGRVSLESIHDVYVSSEYAYVAQGHLNRPFGSLKIIDISEPAQARPVGHLDIEESVYGVWVSGHYAYVAATREGLLIVNVSDPSDPHEVGRCGADARYVQVSGSYAYVAAGAGLSVVDVSDPSHPYEVGYFSIGGQYCNHVHVSGNHAYTSDLYRGLHIIDVSDPFAPTLAGYFKSLENNWECYSSGDYIYLTGTGGLYILKFTGIGIDSRSYPSPAQSVLVQNYPNPFSSEVSIEYALSEACSVLIELYNCQGQLIWAVENGVQRPGRHRVLWDGRSEGGQTMANGVYFCRLSATVDGMTRRILGGKLIMLK